MIGLPPEVIAALVLAASLYYVGTGIVAGIKKAGHGVKTVAMCIVHPKACGDDRTP